MMRSHPFHWASTLTLIVLGLGALFMLMISAGLGISSLFGLFTGRSDPAALMISSFAFGFQVIVLMLCGWFVLQKASGREQADNTFRFPFFPWQIPAAIVMTGLGVVIGGAAAATEIGVVGWVILPVLTILVIIPPIWILFGLGVNGLDLGPRWRFFATLGLSMTLAPLLMLVIEGMLAILLILAGAVLLVISQSPLMDEIMSILPFLDGGTDPAIVLELLSPFITNPMFIGAGIGYIAVLVPLVEEALKPLAVWLFAKRIESPAQGFALGLLSGAGFAIFESLNASTDGTIAWSVIVSARAGTSLLHLVTSGLVGWGIASAFREKRFWRLAAAYFAAVLIHGIWNAAAAGTGLSTLGESVGRPEWLFTFLPALLCGMLVLGIGMVAVLVASNRRLRREEQARMLEETDERVQLPA